MVVLSKRTIDLSLAIKDLNLKILIIQEVNRKFVYLHSSVVYNNKKNW